jgi:deferrochelatase/peroxidase EfeB
VSATEAQVTSWRGSGMAYQKIAAEIAEWARTQERGSVLPDNEVFGRKADVEASPSTYTRAKQFLVTHGVLEINHGPFCVA